MPKKPFSDKVAYVLMLGSLFSVGAIYGEFADSSRAFPMKQMHQGIRAWHALAKESERHEFLDLPGGEYLVKGAENQGLAPGLIMVSGLREDKLNTVRIIDRTGTVVHEWVMDWFELWPDASEFHPAVRPVSQPGAVIHGAEILPNGSVVFNFEFLSTIKLNACGDVIWKLNNAGHHSVDIDGEGNIWVASIDFVHNRTVEEANHVTPTDLAYIQKISPDGDILETISILEVFRENGLHGLLYLSSIHNFSTTVSGDTMHLNDIEIFPEGMQSSIFEAGDIMVSLRNINTVFVMSPDTHKIKFITSGQFVRQHDPDFINGDKILVFDNNNHVPDGGTDDRYSRILKVDALTGEASIYFQAPDPSWFFSDIMGKQQLLDNGNILITSARQGRVFEVSPSGEILWEYNNLVDEGYNGVLTQATLLPQNMDYSFFESLTESCLQ